eukprot:CAMPEP_0183295636 /NCGR_PEP_ID=MMETSP0160_2-20130417/3522_1 /TAXON_ID=2839 ORGANISM="Odontella Sinensis, Strain Grunow 1884" /NCGR_SAMPLE_ID=MMETSP0160_2 /ASSEMBLY_ACC=CAM_ASM_000250 /LENGTH=591 /DNA_ID=CAMNT_0025457151 /DNA_START=48 /DNA_END=1826 /DNA_ORIENTATION=+
MQASLNNPRTAALAAALAAFAATSFGSLDTPGYAHAFAPKPAAVVVAGGASKNKSPPPIASPAVLSPLFSSSTASSVETRSAPGDMTPIEEVGPDDEGEVENDKFDWFRCWHPLTPVEYLDPAKPHKFTLLGVDLVVWNDGHTASPVENGVGTFRSVKDRPKGAVKLPGIWRAFEDKCPHRKVPLSEGRVEDDGTLLCSYHAWRFDGEGEVVSVPQALEETDELTKIKANPKSKCGAFPAKVVGGLLWVWGDNGPDAVLESELTDVPMMKLPHEEDETIDPKDVITTPWNNRHLPYGHDYFIENVVDPAHVPASHHNIVGSRYTGTTPLRITTERPVTSRGFAIRTSKTATSTFVAPGHVKLHSEVNDQGATQTLELYSSPSVPGFCNHMGRQVIVKSKDRTVPQMLKTFTLPIPVWVLHLLGNTFLNQDALFLHEQERTMDRDGLYSTVGGNGDDVEGANGGADRYNPNVLPISADKGVIMFREWMRTKAGGKIPYRGNRSMPPVSKDDVFDIYNSHTKDCKYCNDALRRLKKVRKASFIAAAVVGVLRPGKLGVVGSTVLAGALGGVGLVANKVVKLLHKMEFSHAEND